MSPGSRQSAKLEDSFESKTGLDLLLDLSFDAILIRDAHDRVEYWNHRASEMYGYALHEALGRTSHELLRTEFPEPLDDIRRALERDGRWAGELTHARKDGSKVTVSSRWSLKRDLDGNVAAILEINRDITEQKRINEQLRETAERFRRIYEHAPTGIAITDLSGKFLQCNPAYEALLGYTEDEYRQMSFPELVHPDDRESNMVLARRLIAGELPYFIVENRYCNKAGEAVWVQKRVSLMPDTSGKPAYILALITNIGERKRAEEKLRASENEAKARAAELSAILDAVPAVIFMAHDAECRRISCSREGYEMLRIGTDANASLTAPQEERPSHFRVLKDARELSSEELPMQMAAGRGVEVRNCEIDVAFADGTQRHLLGNAIPLFDGAGKPRGSVGAFVDITDRMLAEQQRRESEEKLRLFIEHAPAALAMFDRDMRYLAASRRWKQDYSLSEDVIGRSHYDLFPEIPQRWKDIHRRGFAGEVIREDEDPFYRRDGSVQWIKWEVRPWYAADGSVGGILIAAEDVTEQVTSKKKILESEAQFRTLANAIPQLCWMANPDGWIFWYNDRWYEYTGTTPQQMEGWGWQSVHDPEVLPTVLERWKQSIDKREPFEMVFPLRGADGVFRPHLTRVTPVKDDQGNVARWFGTNTDITEQKKIQQELHASEALYRATFDNAAVGIAHVALDGRFLRINNAMCTIAGYTQAELLEKTFADITHPEDIEADWQQARRLLSGEVSYYAMEKRYVRKDGSIVWVNLTASLLRDESGRAERFVAVVEDITRRKFAEQAMIRSEKLASAGRLASTIAHEINNPLEVVMNLMYLIRNDETLPDPLREHVFTAEAELQRVSQMARRTLSFYRGQSKQGRYSVAALVEDVLRLYSPVLLGRNIRLEKRLNQDSEVSGLSSEIRQVCMNLISNAIDAEPTLLAIRVSQRTSWKNRGMGAVRITVADDGMGMDRETMKHIFEPFFTTKTQTGTGLGLWVCQEIVRNHGGSIRVRSNPARGTVFSLYLPTGLPKTAG